MTQEYSTRRPGGLFPAAALLAVQAVGFVVFAVLELLSTQPNRPEVGITTGVMFVVYGVLLGIAAWGVLKALRWARSVAAFTQILHVPVAWSFAAGSSAWVAVVVIGLSAVVLVLLFLPSSTAAFTAPTQPAEQPEG